MFKSNWRHPLGLLAGLLLTLAGHAGTPASNLTGNPAAPAPSALYFVIGDTGDCTLPGTAQVAQVLRQQADAAQATLLELGDLGYPIATRQQLLGCHEAHFSAFPRRLAVPGNHDWADSGGLGFFATFPGDIPRQENLNGDWRILLLNSNLRESAAEAQLRWLDKVLAENAGKCLIAAWHHPRWSSGKHGDNPAMHNLWARMQRQATFTLHGHDHHFEALPALDLHGAASAQGVASFIVGNGGAIPYKAGLGPTHSAQAHYGDWGFMRLELDGKQYRWAAINTAGKTLAQGNGTCSPAGAQHAP
jgi:hypothetical protein